MEKDYTLMNKAAEKNSKNAFGNTDWCDIYKGIAIILVVIGYASGRFNQYIYQFHIAAFFFIFGYTGTVRNNTVFEEFIKKFYLLMVPYYIIGLTGIGFFWVLSQAGVLSVVSATQYPASFQDALLGLLAGNEVYCDWLGMMWLLQVMFWADIFFTILAWVCKKDVVLALASVLLFLASTGWALSGGHPYYIDMAGIAQIFLVMGYLASKIKEGKNNVWLLLLKIALIALVWWGSIQLGFNYIVDWAHRKFNGAVDLILPICGILLMIYLSRLLERNRAIKRLFMCLGRNSMGIICFCFLGFKPAYIVLALSGKMEMGDLYWQAPDAAIWNWWPFTSVVAIVFCVLLWKAINRYSVSRILAGGGSVERIYDNLLSTKLAGMVKEVYDLLVLLFRQTMVKYWDFLKKERGFKIAAVVSAAVIFGCAGIRLYSCSRGEINVTFPYKENEVIFKNGWLPQSNEEDYRWFEKQAVLQAFLVDQNNIKIAGYFPDNIENISYISIKVNNVEVYQEPAASGQMIDIQLDVSEYVKHYWRNTFEIETDGSRIPQGTDEDQRKLSALINLISFY